ncbi:C-type lectin domain family 4 member M-like [Cheilinus undulatus]|uniref:C-type lectin domain family 4 member M-like n=1 Tax=Cheilinus undulatus TaxID=241271 RepID=UPI001BD38658|nr:C-type lectin domain family 4 member M-like [Cheilinus undulatus]
MSVNQSVNQSLTLLEESVSVPSMWMPKYKDRRLPLRTTACCHGYRDPKRGTDMYAPDSFKLLWTKLHKTINFSIMEESDMYVYVTNITPAHSGQGKNLAESSQKVDAYENISQSLETSTVGTSLSDAQDVKKKSYRIATVCLGLLCALLLTGLIVLAVLYTTHVSEWKSGYKELHININNITEDRNQLQTSYNNLSSERDQLQTSYNNLASERDQLQTNYNHLASEQDQLQTSYNNLSSERDQLQTSYNNLASERDQLQTSYNNLASERDQLQTSYNNLSSERDQLQTNYNHLASERDQLQASNNNLVNQRDQLQTSNNNLVNQRDQLQTSNNNLVNEKNQLQSNYNNLVNEKQQLQKSLEQLTSWRSDLPRRLQAHNGWVYFSGSFYFVSSLERSWNEGRADCRSRGADLMIFNSREEQSFARTFKKRLWVGLTDIQTSGIWKWVDGTPLTTSYWAPGEPNGGHEHCAETMKFDLENSLNDAPCSTRHYWICEKRFAL